MLGVVGVDIPSELNIRQMGSQLHVECVAWGWLWKEAGQIERGLGLHIKKNRDLEELWRWLQDCFR